MGTQMSSVHDVPSDDDSHLRVSGNAVNPTITHCSSVDERIEPRKERPEKEKEKEKESVKERERDRSEKEKDREKDKEKERDKDRDKDDRKGSGATISLPVAGEEWRRWKDNIACQDYAILNTLGRGAFADVCCPTLFVSKGINHNLSTAVSFTCALCRWFWEGTSRLTSTMP